MFSSDNCNTNYSNNNNNGVHPMAFLFSPPPPSSHEHGNLAAASLYQHHHHHHHRQNLHPSDPFMAHHQQLSYSVFNPNQMAPITSIDSLLNYKASLPNNIVDERDFMNDFSEVEINKGKKPLKRDRHSKIHTAQGLRDRRVRLSIKIARKFFDLQDMLGFDKASKTLEWLLQKSRKAIKQLAKAKKHRNRYKDCDNNCYEEEDDDDNDDNNNNYDNGDYDNDDDDEKSFISGSSSEYCVELMGFGTNKLVRDHSFLQQSEKKLKNEPGKGSRAKAKERAKERRRNIDQSETILEIKESQILNPQGFMNQIEVEERPSTSVNGQNMMPCLYKQMIEESIGESTSIIMNKKKPWLSIPSYSDQQNGGDMLKDPSSRDNYSSNLPQNWDIYDHNPLGFL